MTFTRRSSETTMGLRGLIMSEPQLSKTFGADGTAQTPALQTLNYLVEKHGGAGHPN